MSDGRKIIIVKRKKKAKHAHHGGSWKVAYADFVTAMMAFFMVMWIMGMDEGVKDMVQGYFENPVGYKKGFGGGQTMISQGNAITNLEIRRTLILKRREEQARMAQTGADIQGKLDAGGLLEDLDAEVEVTITDRGLRVELMETGEGGTFFDRSSASLKTTLQDALAIVARSVAELPNAVIVEGHTDGASFGGNGYSNWELSVDRANAARRILVASGLPGDRLVEVRGYADRQLKTLEDPLSATNRRISLLLPFDTADIPTSDDTRALAEAVGLVEVGDGP